MKLRTFSVLLLAAGLLLLLAGAALPFAFIPADVIGGAGGPSFWFHIHHKLHDAPIALVLLAAATMLSAVVSLVFSGAVKHNCAPGTSALALGLSTCVSAGLVCALELVFLEAVSRFLPCGDLAGCIGSADSLRRREKVFFWMSLPQWPTCPVLFT